MLAEKLKTDLENVNVLSVMHNTTDDSTDVRFAAHGSPWYQSSRLDGIVTSNLADVSIMSLVVRKLVLWYFVTGSHQKPSGWLGRAMVLGSFQCRGVLLLWHMVGQGPAVLAAGAGQVGCFLIFLSSLSYLPFLMPHLWGGERGGSVVECRTPEREVGGSKPTAAVLCPWARHFTPRKYWLITQEAVAPSRHDWKIVDWDVKPQHKQNHLWGDGCICWNIVVSSIITQR